MAPPNPTWDTQTRGLKLGIYLNNGAATCQGYTGSEAFLSQDIETISSWGVDGLKLDGCHMHVQ